MLKQLLCFHHWVPTGPYKDNLTFGACVKCNKTKWLYRY